MQSFKTEFTLSRDYLGECFDQTLPHGKNAKPNFLFPALSFAAGVGLVYFTEQYQLAGGVLIALAALELIHIRYRRAWWLTRQMWGRNANSTVTLSVDDEGISTQNFELKTTLLWADVARVIETEAGLILVNNSGGQQYLSKAVFPDDVVKEIMAVSNP